MASLPNQNQVAGKHIGIFEAYYKQVDPKSIGSIEAAVAANFLKKSALSHVVLSRIWDLSDPTGKGYLDKSGLFVALKLVALAQSGHDINMRNIYMDINPPKVGEIPKVMPTNIQNISPNTTDWSLKQADREKYEKLYESLKPVNGLIPGNTVKGVLMESKLPLVTLGKIWDLADQDADGSLDKHEFIVAMHLVYQALDKRAVPTTLPTELQKPISNLISSNFNDGNCDFVANFPTEMSPPEMPQMPMSIAPMSRIPQSTSNISNISLMESTLIPTKPPPPYILSDWVVTPNDKMRYDAIFTASDMDRDGLVSGMEIKDVFLKSGLASSCLAKIWGLCDTNQSGKLTSEQFALAMWLVERQKNGIEPPNVLAPNMIPPSLKLSNNDFMLNNTSLIQPEQQQQPTYSNPELEMISKEIEELAKERRILETDIAQKEADIRIKTGEVSNLEDDLNKLSGTLKQLEIQKGEAQKRLDDLKSQVNKFREQCQKQEVTIKDQESELESKRSELQKLKDEENSLTNQYSVSLKELDNLTKKLQDTQLQISQIKAMVTQLQENQRQMNDALALCKIAIEENDPTIVSEYSLKLEPEFRDVQKVLNLNNEPKKTSFDDDPFKSNGFATDPFTNISNGISNFNSDLGSSGFEDAFSTTATKNNNNNNKSDPFAASDPFGDKKSNFTSQPDPSKDEFGSDPFAILHAPTSANQILSPSAATKSGPPPRPESPSPALPPKKAKQPPPRPAPPRPTQGPTVSKPITNASDNSMGFADFADFDIKKAADFSEDPFKDYRYEDLFNIKDPFADEEFEDPFKNETGATVTTKPPTIINNKDGIKLVNNTKNKNNNFADFEAFNNNKNNNKINSNNNLINNNNSNNNNNLDSTDFFDSFNENFNKNTYNKNNEILFDAFGDDKLNNINNKTNNNDNFKLSQFNNDFKDSFHDDFSKLQTDFITSTTTVTNTKSINNKFELNLTNKLNHRNNKSLQNDVKVTEKFDEDYSKTDNFDADLKEALKRSMLEK